MNEGSSSVVIFAGSFTEAAVVRSVLEPNGIAARLVDEHVGAMAPYLAVGGGAGAVKVAVAADDAGTAKALLADRHPQD